MLHVYILTSEGWKGESAMVAHVIRWFAAPSKTFFKLKINIVGRRFLTPLLWRPPILPSPAFSNFVFYATRLQITKVYYMTWFFAIILIQYHAHTHNTQIHTKYTNSQTNEDKIHTQRHAKYTNTNTHNVHKHKQINTRHTHTHKDTQRKQGPIDRHTHVNVD